MRTRLLTVVTTAALIALILPAGNALADHAWNGYHWARTSNPFTLVVQDNVDSTWDAYLVEARNDWSQSSVLDLTIRSGSFGSVRNCRPDTGYIEACNASYGNNGWLGLASIWVTGGEHITKGSTKVNDYYFSQAQYNTPAWRRLVMCQEIAHDFGLDHQDENFDNANLGSCMDYTSDPDGPPSNVHPNAHDFDQIAAIYAHLDSFTTIGTGAASVGEVGNDPASWGRLVSGSASRGHGVYVRDFGHGNLVITHVIWA